MKTDLRDSTSILFSIECSSKRLGRLARLVSSIFSIRSTFHLVEFDLFDRKTSSLNRTSAWTKRTSSFAQKLELIYPESVSKKRKSFVVSREEFRFLNRKTTKTFLYESIALDVFHFCKDIFIECWLIRAEKIREKSTKRTRQLEINSFLSEHRIRQKRMSSRDNQTVRSDFLRFAGTKSKKNNEKSTRENRKFDVNDDATESESESKIKTFSSSASMIFLRSTNFVDKKNWSNKAKIRSMKSKLSENKSTSNGVAFVF